jgi:Fe-S-cluster containining protein
MDGTIVRRANISVRNKDGSTHTLTTSLPTGRITLDGVISLLHLICDTITSIQLSKIEVSCRKGCANCCYQLIPVSAAEGLFLNKLLQTMPRSRRRKIERGFHAAQKRLLPFMSVANGTVSDFDRRYFQMGIPCPFLDDNRCSIYQERPLACREYHVNTPKDFCSNPYKTNPNRVAKGLNLGALLSAFCAHLLPLDQNVFPLYSVVEFGPNHAAARATFDAEWVFTKLLSGVAKAGALAESISGIDWEIVNECSNHPMGAPPNLFQLIEQGASTNRHRIEQALENGLAVDQGNVLTPNDPAKQLVRHAHAANIEKIVSRLIRLDPRLKANHLIVEIGAGDGYFRYLGNLSNNNDLTIFFSNTIETESNEQIVRNNRSQGKRTLLLDVCNLNKHFGARFSPLVVSFNVLDVFDQETLRRALKSVSNTLMPDGRIIHIMSSAIHPSVFLDIAANNPEKVLLPLHSDGSIGVVLVHRTQTLPTELANLALRPDYLPALFRNSPDGYLSAAAQAQSWIRQIGVTHEPLLLHEYSISKLSNAMTASGFVIEFNEFVDSSMVIERDDISKTFDENTISSVLGLLTLNHGATLAEGRIKQSSRFAFIVGRKLGTTL